MENFKNKKLYVIQKIDVSFQQIIRKIKMIDINGKCNRILMYILVAIQYYIIQKPKLGYMCQNTKCDK